MSPQWSRIKSVWRFHTIIRTRHSPINSKNAPRAHVISTVTTRVTTRLRTVVTRAASPRNIVPASARCRSRGCGDIPHPQPGASKESAELIARHVACVLWLLLGFALRCPVLGGITAAALERGPFAWLCKTGGSLRYLRQRL